MDAPERIWATEDAANFGEDKFHTTRPMSGLTEYIRADLCADPALLAEAVEVLRPFADHAQDRQVDDPAWRDSYTMSIVVTVAELRAARAFLSKLENRHE